MRAFLYHINYDVKAGLRDKTQLLMNYLFPLGFFVIVGSLMTSINPPFIEIMIGGMILFASMSTALLSLPGTMVSDRESGVYRSFRINGVPASSLISVPIIGNFIHIVIVSIIITFLSIGIFGAPALVSIGGFVLFILLSGLTLLTLGVLIGIVSQQTRFCTLVSQAIYLPSVLLGGLMVPQSMLPPALAQFSYLLPASHSMNLFTSLAMGQHNPSMNISFIVLVSSILVNVVLSCVLFNWEAKAEKPKKLFLALLALVPYIISVIIQ